MLVRGLVASVCCVVLVNSCGSDDCACASREENRHVEFSCYEESACPSLNIRCDSGDCPVGKNGDRGWQIDDNAALACVLQRLHDQQPGLLRWEFTGYNPPGYERVGYELVISEDGRALFSRYHVEDLGGEQDPVTIHELTSPEEFQACLDATELGDRVRCLLNPVGAQLNMCLEGGYIDYIL